MLLVFEIVLFFAGLYALITSKIPGLLVGWNRRGIEDPLARIVGILLMAPVPVAFVLGIFLGIFFGEEALYAGTCVELILLVICFSAALILINTIRKREVIEPEKMNHVIEPGEQDTENEDKPLGE